MKKNNQKTVHNSIQQNRGALSNQRPRHRNPAPLLRFSPTAWAKLLYFRDRSDNEVGGFGITEPDDLLYVREFITVKQEVSIVSVEFDDEAVADFFDTQVDQGRQPEQFGRIWLHSHPGDSPLPSDIDEETFARVFGKCQWAAMFIIAQNNDTYARLSFNVGPGGHVLIPVEIDYSRDFGPGNHEHWENEYDTNVSASQWPGSPAQTEDEFSTEGMADYVDFMGELERMEPAERQCILDELAERSESWDQESEVCS
jgi:proteasome lid subunit RPN8/RPN11